MAEFPPDQSHRRRADQAEERGQSKTTKCFCVSVERLDWFIQVVTRVTASGLDSSQSSRFCRFIKKKKIHFAVVRSDLLFPPIKGSGQTSDAEMRGMWGQICSCRFCDGAGPVKEKWKVIAGSKMKPVDWVLMWHKTGFTSLLKKKTFLDFLFSQSLKKWFMNELQLLFIIKLLYFH